MSTIVIGLSHRSAPIATLERAALDPAGRADLLERLSGSEQLHEVLLLDTCNRVEVYAEAATFHGAVTEIGEALAAATGMPLAELRDNLYVHFSDRAVAHLFSVSAGLDSMAVGEAQILGQLRESLREGRAAGHVGSGLDGLVQQALRVGKRAHSETDIDGVSRSLIERGIGLVEPHLGSLTELRVAVVGAGAMSSLAAHTISRAGCGSLTVVNRTFDAAQRLAGAVGATARDWSELSDVLAESDLVVSCTGAVGHVIDESLLPAATPTPTAETRFQRSDPAAAESERYNRVSGERGPVRRQAFIDLALPRDVAVEVGERPGVLLVSLEDLGDGSGAEHDQVGAVRSIVAGEVDDYLVARRAASVAPTVALLRAHAADVVAQELTRLRARTPGLSESDDAQVQLTVHRVVDKLLHTPTVRMKQLAGEGHDYTAALRELFDLDPRHTEAVRTPPPELRDTDPRGGER